MADPFAAFEGRYGTQSGGGGDVWSGFENRFSIAKMNPANSQRAGGLENVNIKQLASLGYKPSDLGADYERKQMSKAFGGAGDTFSRLFKDLSDNDRKKLLEQMSKMPNSPLKDILNQKASEAPGASWGSNVMDNVKELGTDKKARALSLTVPLAGLAGVLGAGKAIPKPVSSFGETYNQNLLGGLGREAVNLGGAANSVMSLGGILDGGRGSKNAQMLKDTLFPEQGTKNSLSTTKREDIDGWGKAGALAGSAGKTLTEVIGTGAFGKVAKEATAANDIVQGLSKGGKVAQFGAKALPWLAESTASSGLQTAANGGDIKKGIAEGVGYDAVFNIATKGLGKVITKAKIPQEIGAILQKQKSFDDLLRVASDIKNLAPKARQELFSHLDDSVKKAGVLDSAPKAIAQDFYPDNLPKKAVYDAIADPNIEQGNKFDAGIKAYRQNVPNATTEEAATAVHEVLGDINSYSTGGVRKGLASAETAIDTGITDKGVRAAVRRIFNPIANLGDETKQSFVQAAGTRYAAQTQRTTIVNELRQTAKKTKTKLDMDLAHNIENGTAPDNALTRQFRETADQLRKDAIDAGVDIGYKENYVPHIWQKSADEVDQIARGFGMKPRAAGERIVPTYEEGIKLGLKPKYKDPAEMMGDYVTNLQNSRSNVALIKDLNEQGLLVEGKPPAGWKTITAEGFPRSAGGNQLSAPPELARTINNIYGQSDSLIDKALGKTARFNSVWQDIALAGGVPKTPANFFTFAQIMKEEALAAGHILHPIKGAKQAYNPLAAFVTSFSKGKTASIQKANQGFLNELAQAGAPLNFSTGAKGWDGLFNDPTFGRFMPTMQLGTAKNVFSALEKKVGKDEAMKQTADIMKKMYGITDQLATGRSQAVQDAIGTVGFAPKYRESIMNVLGNTLKAVADPRTYKDSAYSLNRRLAVGMGVTFAAYNAINYAQTGHSMLQNPEGKELQLAIPYGGKNDKGEQNVLYIPFMPSFMTIPRAAVGAAQSLAKGDIGGIGNEAGKMLSMPIQTGSQLLSNRDYFGRPIVIDDKASQETGKPIDSGWDMLKKRGLYMAGQGSPALVRAGLDKLQGKPLEQVLATAGEAPVRFGKFYGGQDKGSNVSPGQISGDFYDKYNIYKSQASALETEINKGKYRGADYNEASGVGNKFNDNINKEFADFFKKYGKQLRPEDREKYESMLDNIKVDVRKNKKSDKYYVNKF